jgi:hypothetical protein
MRAFAGNPKPRQLSIRKPARSIAAKVSTFGDGVLVASEARSARAHVLVEAQLAARPQDAAELLERGALIGNRAQHAGDDDRVDRAVLGGKRVGRAGNDPNVERQPPRGLLCGLTQVGLRLDREQLRDRRRDVLEVDSVSGPHLDHPSLQPGEQLAAQRVFAPPLVPGREAIEQPGEDWIVDLGVGHTLKVAVS